MTTVREPIFLTGTVRAGTTLLARILGRHPRLRYLGFELSEEWSRAGVPIASVETADACCPAVGADRATPELRRAIAAKMAVAAADGDGRRAINKNPHLFNKLPLVHALFPDAALVVVSRDLRSTAASTRRLWESVAAEFGKHHALPVDGDACWSCLPAAATVDLDPRRVFPGGDVAVIGEYWLRVYETIEAEWRRFPRRVAVRHSDLVADPAATLGRVADALGLGADPWDPGEPLDASRNDRWRRTLAAQERERLDAFVAREGDRIAALTVADTAT
jgi:hypothetical protein